MNRQHLSKTMLFREMSEKEIEEALTSLSAMEKQYKKGSVILLAGKTTQRLGMVLDGSVTIESNDVWGNRTILSHVGEGHLFAETYALLENAPMLVDVVANGPCRILFLRIDGIRKLTDSSALWTRKFIVNLLSISAHKNLTLSGRSFHTSPKTIRGRVMAYLNSLSLQKGVRSFDIPFDRQQLADYLGVDRTALSKELGKMQRDDLLVVQGRHFIVNA